MAKTSKLNYAIGPTFNIKFRYRFLIIMLSILFVYFSLMFSFSLWLATKKSTISIRSFSKCKFVVSAKTRSNMIYTQCVLTSLSHTLTFICIMWMITLLLSSGDVHPNPGPSDSNVSSDYTSSTNSHDLYTFLNYTNYISTVHYNVQSIRYKLDLLLAEFSQFDIISFTETWLSGNCPTSDLIFPSYYAPERKDRISDRYGGVMVYIKDSISYIRRNDLEINGLECIWVQIKLCNKRNICLLLIN